MTQFAPDTGGRPGNLSAALEALLFVLDRPVPASDLARWLGVPVNIVVAELERLGRELDGPNRGIRLAQEAGGYRLLTKPEWKDLIERVQEGNGARRELSRACLEVLAIIAYRQPITRAEVDDIRGVRSERALARLMEEGLVEVAGRAEGLGRPLLFRTTQRFLEFVGLSSLDQLPPLEGGDERRGEGPGSVQLPLNIPLP